MGKDKILIVDDMEANRELLRSRVEVLGHSSVLADNGLSALAQVKKQPPDLVLLDIMMPEMDGFQFLEIIKSEPRWSRIPVIVLSALDDMDSVVRCIELGAVDYLVKPFNPTLLKARIESSLVRKQLHDSSEAYRRQIEDYNLKLEERIKERTGELRKSNQELQEFLKIAVHDLQEPLRKVVIFGDRLTSGYSSELGDRGRDYLERVQKGITRMQGLLEDLACFTAVTSKETMHEPVHLEPLVSQIFSGFNGQIKKAGVRVEIGELPTLEGDSSQILQLFQHLINNALVYRKEKEALVVRVGSRRGENGFWEIFVEDNGIGFEEKYLDRIFKPFERLHHKSEYQGNGMGLAICRKIVARHQGEITAASVVGEGSTFHVKLPEKQSTEKEGLS